MTTFASLTTEFKTTGAEATKAQIEALAVSGDKAESSLRQMARAVVEADAGYRATARSVQTYGAAHANAQSSLSQMAAQVMATDKALRAEAAGFQMAIPAVRAHTVEVQKAAAAQTQAAVAATTLARSSQEMSQGVRTATERMALYNQLIAKGADAAAAAKFAQVNLADATKEVAAAQKAAAGTAMVVAQRQEVMVVANQRATKSMRQAQISGLDLSRQFADIGVQAAMSTNPLMIMAMQGPQIADRFAVMRMEGTTLAMALKSIGATMGGVLLTFGPVVAAIAAVVVVFGLLDMEAKRVEAAMKDAGTALDRLQTEAEETAELTKLLSDATSTSADAARDAADAYELQTLKVMNLSGKIRELNALQLHDEIKDTQKQLTGLVTIANDNGWGHGFRDSPAEELAKSRAKLLKTLGVDQEGVLRGQIARGDSLISGARNNTAGLSSEQRKALDAYNLSELRNTGTATAIKSLQERLAMLRAEANPATKPQDTLVDELTITAESKKKGASGAKGPEDRSAQVINAAANEALQAQAALTRNVEDLARIRVEQIGIERASAVEQLRAQVANKSITASAAEIALVSVDAAAKAKTELVMREQALDIARRDLDHRQSLAQSTQTAAQIQAGLATSAAEQNRIEREALSTRQAIAKDTLALQNREAILYGERTLVQAKELAVAQEALQTAERAQADRAAEQRVRIEQNSLQDAAIDLQRDVLASRRSVSKSTVEQRTLELEILRLTQQQVRIDLQRVIDNTSLSATEREIARLRMEQLGIIEKNQREEVDGGIEGAFRNASDALYSVANAFKTKNWFSLAGTLSNAIEEMAGAFKAGGLKGLSGKVGTAAGAANIIGGAVGGTVGAGLMGAAAGASAAVGLGAASVTAGLVATGPAGWAVLAAAALGGALGIFGKSNAKKKAEREAKERREEEERERQLAVAQEARDQEIEIMRLQGKTLEATAALRADELAKMDASNRARQEEIYLLRDAAEAAEKLAALAANRRELETRLLEAQGKSVEALARRREDEVNAIDPSLQSLIRAIHAAEDAATAAEAAAAKRLEAETQATETLEAAKSNLVDAYNRESGALQTTIDKLRSMSKTLRDFNRSLDTGPSALNSPQRQYEATLAALKAASPEDMPAAASAFLEASKAYQSNSQGYMADFAFVKNLLDDTARIADVGADTAQQQLDVLKAQVSALVTLNESVLSVRDAIAALQLAQAGVAAFSPANDNLANPIGYLDKNPDVADEYVRYAQGTSVYQQYYAPGLSAAEYGQAHWSMQGRMEGRSYATGGIFTNGIVSQPTAFDASLMGEAGPEAIMPLVRGPNGLAVRATGNSDEVVAELRALRAEVQAGNIAIAKTNQEMMKIQRKWDDEGLPLERVA
jgi:hypothetical protein